MFKPSGKYYGEYDTQFIVENNYIGSVWDAVREDERVRNCLEQGFYVLVDVIDHEHNHPHILVGERGDDIDE